MFVHLKKLRRHYTEVTLANEVNWYPLGKQKTRYILSIWNRNLSPSRIGHSAYSERHGLKLCVLYKLEVIVHQI